MVWFCNFISHMLQQRRGNILISLLFMRQWSRYFFHQLKLYYEKLHGYYLILFFIGTWYTLLSMICLPLFWIHISVTWNCLDWTGTFVLSSFIYLQKWTEICLTSCYTSYLYLHIFFLALNYPSFSLIQVSAYLLGEYGHLLARRPSCSPKELFAIINDKLPTVS